MIHKLPERTVEIILSYYNSISLRLSAATMFWSLGKERIAVEFVVEMGTNVF